MRHAARAALAATLLVMPLRAPAQPAEKERFAEEVISRERQWAEAMQNRDASALEQILHPQFRLIIAYAPVPPTPRQAWLNSTMRELTIRRVSIEQAQATVNQAVAVVTMWMELDWEHRQRGVLPPRYHLTDTWKLENGRWQVLSRVSQLPDHAIRALFDAGAAAWNRGNIDGYLASYCDSEQTLWVSDGARVEGRTAISKAFHGRFPSREKMGRLQAQQLKIEFVNPAQVLVNGRWVQTLADKRRSGTFTTRLQSTTDGWCAIEDRSISDPAADQRGR